VVSDPRCSLAFGGSASAVHLVPYQITHAKSDRPSPGSVCFPGYSGNQCNKCKPGHGSAVSKKEGSGAPGSCHSCIIGFAASARCPCEGSSTCASLCPPYQWNSYSPGYFAGDAGCHKLVARLPELCCWMAVPALCVSLVCLSAMFHMTLSSCGVPGCVPQVWRHRQGLRLRAVPALVEHRQKVWCVPGAAAGAG
jgi:hypothetical protein